MQRKSLRGLAKLIVREAADKSPKELGLFMHQVVSTLQQSGQLSRWRELERDLHAAWRELYGVSKISVVTAHQLTPAAEQQLTDKAGGAELNVVVNPRLLGGAVVRADDKRLDGSVLGALTRLKQTLLT